jgi:hypothetical protein
MASIRAMTRRHLLAGTALAAAWAAAPRVAVAASLLTVHKTPWCGCCTAWAEHMAAAGFAVAVEDSEDLDPIKRSLGVPVRLESCHTGVIEGYVIEGHVPAAVVERLLAERPEGIAGLAVPGMPAGSPGMEFGTAEAYDVIAFGPAGERVYTSIVP